MIHAVLFLYLSHSLVFWPLPASQPAGDTKKRSNQSPRTCAAMLMLPDNDDNFETVGQIAGGNVAYNAIYCVFQPIYAFGKALFHINIYGQIVLDSLFYG